MCTLLSACALLLAAPAVTALRVPQLQLSRRAALFGGGGAALALKPSASQAEGSALAAFQGAGFSISVPPSYYRSQGRPRTGLDDTIFAAADYASGRIASVSRTLAVELLVASGDTLPATLPPPVQLRELGKPSKVAALLARRRDGDPQGLQPARSTVVSAVRSVDGSELLFTLSSLSTTATSMTSARPSARAVQGRALFVPADASGSAPYLLTAWASSNAATQCEAVPCECGEGARLDCGCPPPVCAVDADAPADSTDLAIISSLRVTPRE